MSLSKSSYNLVKIVSLNLRKCHCLIEFGEFYTVFGGTSRKSARNKVTAKGSNGKYIVLGITSLGNCLFATFPLVGRPK